MTAEVYGLLVRLHGHLAVLGLALLLHPVITLSRRKALTKWTRWTAYLAAGLVALPFALGWLAYPTYREQVKPGLFQREHPALLLFESKEHLAALAVALAVSGALVLRAAGSERTGRRAAWSLLLAAWLCGTITTGLGIYVSAVAQPGW